MADPVPSNNLALLKTFLSANPDIHYFRYQWLDLAGNLRARVTTRKHMLNVVQMGKSFDTPSPMMAFMFDDSGPFDLVTNHCDGFIPDMSSLRACTYQPGSAAVMCHYRFEKTTWDCCPRTLLKRTLERAKRAHGIDMLVGFEIEFLFLDPAQDAPSPLKLPHNGTSTTHLLRGPRYDVVEETVRQIEEAGIEVRQFHAEMTGAGYEISLAPMPLLEGVDALLYALEALRSVSEARGQRVTLHPAAIKAGPAIGQHAHLSIAPADKEDAFLAGMLKRLPALMALSMPIYDSYTRVGKGFGEWLCWGLENKFAPIRKIKTGHWEVRTIDAAANMYLALSGFIHAGLMGIEEDMELKIKDTPFNYAGLTEEQRKDSNVERRMPKAMKETWAALKDDKALTDRLGEKMMEFLEIKKREEERWAAMEPDERRIAGVQVW